jgi:hypothetical protein
MSEVLEAGRNVDRLFATSGSVKYESAEKINARLNAMDFSHV